jgi:hypothetical protein
MLVGDDMDNWMANKIDDVDSLYVEIDNLNDPVVEFYFIKDISSDKNILFKNILARKSTSHLQQ